MPGIVKVKEVQENTATEGVTYRNGIMMTFNNNISNDVTITSGLNAIIAGPITVNNMTVAGNLKVFQTIDVTGYLAITGTMAFL